MMPTSRTSLTDTDYSALASRWIDRDSAHLANLRRIDNLEGRSILGRNGGGNYEGISIPYSWPGEDRIRDHRVRRDHPELAEGKPRGKYMSAPGRGSLLYFVPGTSPGCLTDTTLPVLVTEGEFKTIALHRASRHNLPDSDRALFLPVGIPGVWNWRGTIGKTCDQNGARVDEKGPISDLSRIEWNAREVTIVFDRDAESNKGVQDAQRALTKELQRRGAKVRWFIWPEEAPTAKGIDDLLAAIGPDKVLEQLSKSESREVGIYFTQVAPTGCGRCPRQQWHI